MRTRLLALAAFVVVVLLSPIGSVEACGPWFEDDVFVSTNSPDDTSAFAKGQLGILQAGFDSNEYAVAYRYLNGGKLSDAERAIYAPRHRSASNCRRLEKLNPCTNRRRPGSAKADTGKRTTLWPMVERARKDHSRKYIREREAFLSHRV